MSMSPAFTACLMTFRRALMLALLVVPLLALADSPARAVLPDEMLDDPRLEARAREIGQELRCVVCQGENIDESNAELARDMRILVRKRLTAGDSNEEVIGYIQSRYGDSVLMTPPFKPTTYALWFGPFIFLAIALFAGWRFYKRRGVSLTSAGQTTPTRPAADTLTAPLSAEEQARLDALLQDDSTPEPPTAKANKE